jgi:hypothetical protein
MTKPVVDPKPREDFRITERNTRGFFSRFGALVYLRPFLERECTAADAAQELKVSRQRMNYWINKMQRSGLIRRVGQQGDGARAVPVYRSTHDSFVVQMSDLPHASVEGLMDFLVGQWFWERFKRAFTHAWEAGLLDGRIRLYREAGGGIVEVLPNTPKVDEAVHNHWRTFRLDSADVRQLRDEMEQLLDRYAERVRPDAAELVLVHAAVQREEIKR